MISLLALIAAASDSSIGIDGGIAASIYEEGDGGPQISASLGYRVAPTVEVGVDAVIAGQGDGLISAAFPAVRAYTGRSDRARLFGTAGFGIRATSDIVPIAVAGLGVALPIAKGFSARAQARYLVPLAPKESLFAVGIGAEWRQPPKPVVIAPEPFVAPDPPKPLFPDLPGATVWVPHPLCEWLPIADAAAILAVLPPEDLPRDVLVRAPGKKPTWATLEALKAAANGGPPLNLEPQTGQGGVVVVAHRGDLVRVGPVELPTDGDGVAMLQAPEGATSVVVSGAGRHDELEIAVSTGYVTWVRASEPRPLQIGFLVNRADLDPAGKAALEGIARDPGGYTYQISGGYSPEGDLANNIALGTRRAAVAEAALVAAGIDPTHLVVLPIREPNPAETPEQQRSVRVVPVYP